MLILLNYHIIAIYFGKRGEKMSIPKEGPQPTAAEIEQVRNVITAHPVFVGAMRAGAPISFPIERPGAPGEKAIVVDVKPADLVIKP